MVQKVAPSLQHYIKGYYETPEMVCKARLNFLMSPPQMTYRPLFGVFEDLLRGQPYNELLAGISKADSRDWVVKNYKEILLITGKGIHSKKENSVYTSEKLTKLRNSIPEFIKNSEQLKNKVLMIEKAKREEGGDGAFILKLKKL